MALLQLLQLLHTGFLQHPLQHLRRLPVGHEHAVMAGHGSVEPQPIAHHVGLRHRRQLRPTALADEHVATHHHRVQPLGGLFHDLLIEWQLQREQILAKTLASLPSEHGDGRQNLSRRGIGWQPSALSAGMQQDALLRGEPFAEGGEARGLRKSLPEQPGRAAAASHAVALGVAGAEELVDGQLCDVMEHGGALLARLHQVGGQ